MSSVFLGVSEGRIGLDCSFYFKSFFVEVLIGLMCSEISTLMQSMHATNKSSFSNVVQAQRVMDR